MWKVTAEAALSNISLSPFINVLPALSAACLSNSDSDNQRYVKQIAHLIAFLVTGHHAHCLDEGMPRVVHPSLDALVHCPVIWGHLIPQTPIDWWGQSSGHAVVVFAQVREVSTVTEAEKKHYIKTKIYCTVRATDESKPNNLTVSDSTPRNSI